MELVGGPVNFLKAMFQPNDIGIKSYWNVFLDGIAPTECTRLAARRIETPAISGYTNAYSVSFSFFCSCHSYIYNILIAHDNHANITYIHNIIDRQVGCYDGEWWQSNCGRRARLVEF